MAVLYGAVDKGLTLDVSGEANYARARKKLQGALDATEEEAAGEAGSGWG